MLIHAGAGGVGSFAIQYAKLKGATVFTTTSAGNAELVRSLGADTGFSAFEMLRPGGQIVGISPVEINRQVLEDFIFRDCCRGLPD